MLQPQFVVIKKGDERWYVPIIDIRAVILKYDEDGELFVTLSDGKSSFELSGNGARNLLHALNPITLNDDCSWYKKKED